MRIEIPELKRCCCCLPLRRGLIIWIYLKLEAHIKGSYVARQLKEEQERLDINLRMNGASYQHPNDCFCKKMKWVTERTALAAVAVLLLFYFLERVITRSSSWSRITPYVVTSVILILLFLDLGFNILFLISAHRKNSQHMKIYYRYAFVIWILQLLALVGFTGLESYFFINSMFYSLFMIHYMLECSCFMFVLIVLQGYLVILVRSEVRKLERNATFEFTNHSNEPECKAQIVT